MHDACSADAAAQIAPWPNASEPSPLLGYALDGFAIFGPYGAAGELKLGASAGTASNLDECNFDAQHRRYHLTPNAPFVPPCLVGEKGAYADELVAKMLVDVNKNLVPLICAASTKEAAVAYKSALMKRVYVDEAKYGKFAAKVREDGQVELIAVTPKDDGSASLFRDHGSLVFEMFYRVDLTTMGA